jgi:DNA mismatch repair protein MLH1
LYSSIDEDITCLQVNTEILKENAEMINEYFSIHIDQSGNLTRLPVVLDQYTPDMDRLPEFALTLGNDVGFLLLSCHVHCSPIW